MGFPLPGVSLRIADEQNREVPEGEVGSIQVKGPNVFAGYWRMPEKNAQEFTSDGFFITGDMGMVDAQGYVRIVGRSKDMIISGGENIYPAEIENLLVTLSGVAECAVVGLPDVRWGEVPVAVLVRSPDAAGLGLTSDAVMQHLQSRIARYKLPRTIVLVDEMVRSPSGKPDYRWAKARGLTLGPESSAFSFGGMTDRAIVRRILVEAGAPPTDNDIDALLEHYLNALEQEVAGALGTKYQLLPGVTEVLDAVSDRANR